MTAAIASTLAVIAYRRRWLINPVTQVTGVLYTIPSVAAFFLLLPITGRGNVTAVIALLLYTLQIIYRNIVAGLANVPAAAKDAERAGRPVAYVGGYEGQLHFLGRLERPLQEVKLADVGRWRAAHPGGLVLFRKTPASSAPPSLPFRPKRPAAGD